MIPGEGEREIARHTQTFGVGVAQIELRFGITLFGGPLIPFDRFGIVPVDSEPARVAVAQIKLRGGVALFGGPLIPEKRGLFIRGHPDSVGVTVAQTRLRFGAALSRRLFIVGNGFYRVLFDAVPFFITDAQGGLRLGVPLFRGILKSGNYDVFGVVDCVVAAGERAHGNEQKRRGGECADKGLHKSSFFSCGRQCSDNGISILSGRPFRKTGADPRAGRFRLIPFVFKSPPNADSLSAETVDRI